MIDPSNCTRFDRTGEELEEFLLWGILVANKPARRMARIAEELVFYHGHPVLQKLAAVGPHFLPWVLSQHHTGQYTKLAKAIPEAALLSREVGLDSCTVEQLEAVHGIGPKTARFFVLHNRPGQRVAVLDTHVLKFCRDVLKLPVPKQTPTGALYRRLEAAFLNYCDAVHRPPAEVDLEIWNHYTRRAA